MITTAKIGENLIDLAVKLYGHATGVFWLLEDNPSFAIDYEFEAETELKFRDETVRLLELGPVVFLVKNLPDYFIKERQSFWDIVIENQGTIEAVFDLVDANNFDGPTEHIFVGEGLKVLNVAMSPRVQNFMQKHTPIATIEEEDKADGIGFMYIEKNFLSR